MSCCRASMKVMIIMVPPQRGHRSGFDLVDALDQHGPAVTLEPGRRRDGRLFLIGCALPELVRVEPGLVRCGLFGSDAACFVGVVAVAADSAFGGLAVVGDVLGEFNEEVQGLEDLKVAALAAEEVLAGRIGEAQRTMRFGVFPLDLPARPQHHRDQRTAR